MDPNTIVYAFFNPARILLEQLLRVRTPRSLAIAFAVRYATLKQNLKGTEAINFSAEGRLLSR